MESYFKNQTPVYSNSIPIDINQLGSYFGSLHKGTIKSNTIDAIPGYEKNENLDKPITEEELRNVLNGLNAKKAPGCDAIPAIVFKSFSDQLVLFTLQLFNNIVQETFPVSWSTDMIKPLYKKGDTKDPKNYRGITLLPIIGKIFTQVLSNRISLWAENHDILCEAQFGFRKGR